MAFDGIRPVKTDDGEKYELHWGGHVETFDTRTEAEKRLLEKMKESAGAQPKSE